MQAITLVFCENHIFFSKKLVWGEIKYKRKCPFCGLWVAGVLADDPP
jgi:hypothetical protein